MEIEAVLNTPGVAHHAAPWTSHAAARWMKTRTGSQRRRMLEYYSARGIVGATDQEVARALNMADNSVRPRRAELAAMEAIEIPVYTANGREHQHTRKTTSGRAAVVWVITEKGRDMLTVLTMMDDPRTDPR